MRDADGRGGGGVYTRQNFLSIYLPSIALAVGTGIIIPALPVYARSFGVPFEIASLVIIAQQIGHTVAAYPTGALMDRFGRRKVVLAGPVLLAISSLLVAGAGSFPELLIYRFIGGVGEQMWRVGRLTMIADTGGDRERGRQITTMSAMESAGRLLSPAIGGVIAVFWDIRAPFIAHAVLCLLAIIPSFKLIRETAPHLVSAALRRATPSDAPVEGMRALLIYPVIMFFVAQFFASFARGPIFTGQLNLYGAYAYNLGPKEIAVLATATTALAIPISLASGYIMDRFGRKATLVPGFTLMTVAFGLLGLTALVPDVPYHLFMAAYLAVYACVSLTGGNMQTLGSDIAPARVRGQFYGVSQTLGNLGGPLATSGFALLAAVAGYWSGFAFLGATAGISAFILATQVRDRVREERKAPAPVA